MNNLNESSEVKAKNITLGSSLGWIFGIIFGFVGIISLFTSFMSGIIMIIVTVIIFPPFVTLLKKKYNFGLSRNMKIVTVAVLLLMVGYINGDSKVVSENSVQTPPITKQVAPTQVPSKPVTLEEKITKKIIETIGEKNNMGKFTVDSVEITKYKPSELSSYGYNPSDNINDVFIKVNSSENITTNLQKMTLQKEASKILNGVFPVSTDIGSIILWLQIPLKDKYGNIKDDVAIVYSMSRDLYKKVNWTNMQYTDLPALLLSEYKTDDRNNYHETIKF